MVQSLDIGQRQNGTGLRTQHHCQARPVRERKADRHAPKPLTERIADQQEQNDMRYPHDKVHEPRHDRIGRATAQDRNAGQYQGDTAARHRRNEPHPERYGKPRNGAAEHVATHPIGTEGMRGIRRQVLDGEI